jgi:hypothetical protein
LPSGAVLVLALAFCWSADTCSASAFSVLAVDFAGRAGAPQGLIAAAGQPENAVWNPSGLAEIESPAAFVGYMDYMVGIRGGAAGYVGRAGWGGYGCYGCFLTTGDVRETAWDDPAGEMGRTFSHNEFALGLASGVSIGRMVVAGGALKAARQDLDGEAASALLIDLSGGVRIRPSREGSSGPEVRACLVVRNVPLSRWGGGDAPQSSEVGLGLELPGRRLLAGLSLLLGRGSRREVRAGLAALVSRDLEGRLGYRRRIGDLGDGANGLPWSRGLNAGFGVRFGRFWLDYTFEDASPLDNVHRFAVRIGQPQ